MPQLEERVCFHSFSFIAVPCISQVCLKYEGFPSSKVAEIPRHGEKGESFLGLCPAVMITRRRWGKKKKEVVRVGAGVTAGG